MSWGNSWPASQSEYVAPASVNEYHSMHMPNSVRSENLIFECSGCEVIFDPGTPKFAMLVDKSKEAGWHMKWKDEGYDTWCVKCSKKLKK